MKIEDIKIGDELVWLDDDARTPSVVRLRSVCVDSISDENGVQKALVSLKYDSETKFLVSASQLFRDVRDQRPHGLSNALKEIWKPGPILPGKATVVHYGPAMIRLAARIGAAKGLLDPLISTEEEVDDPDYRQEPMAVDQAYGCLAECGEIIEDAATPMMSFEVGENVWLSRDEAVQALRDGKSLIQRRAVHGKVHWSVVIDLRRADYLPESDAKWCAVSVPQ